MKKMIASLLCVVVLLLIPMHTNAKSPDRFENGGELYQYWASVAGWPEYLTGAWSSDGGYENVTFGVTNDEVGRKGAAHILELVEDDATVTIVYQTYPLQYLYRVQGEIEPYLSDELGLIGVGVNAYANRVEVAVEQKRIDDADTVSAINTITEKYGAAVFVEFTDLQYLPVLGGADSSQNRLPGVAGGQTKAQATALYLMAAVIGLLLVALVFSEYKRRRVLVFLTNSGMCTAQAPKPSFRAIEKAVQETAFVPSENLDARVECTILQASKKKSKKDR